MCSDGIIDLDGIGRDQRRAQIAAPRQISYVLRARLEAAVRLHRRQSELRVQPDRYTNDPFVVAQNDRMVAINSALQVDLTGQVCADSIGTRPFSGFGGQLDFIRGAARSKGGVPIIALPATAVHGSVSRIVPVLEPGAGVVTSRADVHYVVTENGIAYLTWKNASGTC